MVSPATITNDASIIETLFNNYQECLNDIKNDSIWQGASRDNAHSKGVEFVNEFKSPILSQMNSLASAAALFLEYKRVKIEYEEALRNYNSAIAAEDYEAARTYESIMNEKKARMEALKVEIKSILANIMGVKLTSTNNITGEASIRISLNSSVSLIDSCKELSQELIARNAKYSLGDGLISGDIERCVNEANKFCCASFTAAALYKSGLLTAEQINRYNYQYTGSGGIPDMLEAAGWTQVSPSEAKPGDVINKYGEHVLIYAGNGQCWDNTSGLVSSKGAAPTGTTRNYDISNCQVWRAPSQN